MQKRRGPFPAHRPPPGLARHGSPDRSRGPGSGFIELRITQPATSGPCILCAMTDRELLERLRDGDQAAFDIIFRTWYAPLVRAAEAMLRQHAAAEEIVQDVMLELWRRRDRLAAEGSPQAYL